MPCHLSKYCCMLYRYREYPLGTKEEKGSTYHCDSHDRRVGNQHRSIHISSIRLRAQDTELGDVEALELIQSYINSLVPLHSIPHCIADEHKRLTLHSNSLIVRNRSLRQRTLLQNRRPIYIQPNLLVQHNRLRIIAKRRRIAQAHRLRNINHSPVLSLHRWHLHRGEGCRCAEEGDARGESEDLWMERAVRAEHLCLGEVE